MIELLAAIGWGLLAFGAVTHVWHHRRLRDLLAMHLDRERLPALALTAIEVGLAVALPAALVAEHGALRWFAGFALVLGVGFVAWVARLLASGSQLPCACSFSAAPPSVWSLARSMATLSVGLYLIVDLTTPPADDTALGTRVATLLVGWAVAGAVFVLPDALAWPEASRALMARVDAYADGSEHEPVARVESAAVEAGVDQ